MSDVVVRRFRWGRVAAGALAVLTGVTPLAVPPASAVLPATPVPTLVKSLRTTPFAGGSGVAMHDHEGLAHVARDNALFLLDDDGRSIYEVDATSGQLRRRIRGFDLKQTPRLGGGVVAGPTRIDDLQGIAYDSNRDQLYVFSGLCCGQTELEPTVFRLTRQGGRLELESYQALPPTQQVAAAAWNPADGSLYMGADSSIWSYDYASNTVGPVISVPGLNGIYGMDFTPDGADLFVARPPSNVTRVNWASKSIVPGWSLDLGPAGLLDARSVDVVDDRLWVSDGFDLRAADDPLRYAVFIFSLDGSTAPPGPSTPPPPPINQPKGKNLVGNAGFEKSLRGWAAGPKTKITRVKSGHSGKRAVHVERTKGKGKISLVDNPGWVPTTAAGTYTATLWVRGKGKLTLRLSEVQSTKTLAGKAAKVKLSKKWKKVTVSLATTKAGASSLKVTASLAGAKKGKKSFDADDAQILLR